MIRPEARRARGVLQPRLSAHLLGALLVEAAQRYLESKERQSVDSEGWVPRPWAKATAKAFDMLRQEECSEVTEPEWWNDEALKVESRVLQAGGPVPQRVAEAM